MLFTQKKKKYQFLSIFLILIINLHTNFIFFNLSNSLSRSPLNYTQDNCFDSKVVIPSKIHDNNGDKIADTLSELLDGKFTTNSVNALRDGDTKVEVVICLNKRPDYTLINRFQNLGAEILDIHENLIYAITAIIPIDKISVIAANPFVTLIENQAYSKALLDTSTVNMGVRGSSYVWDAIPAVKGNPYYSIAILDTGVDSNHTDMSNFLYFQDFSSHGYPSGNNGVDYGHHGTHCASIAAGTGEADLNPNTVKETISYYYHSAVGNYWTIHWFEIKDNSNSPNTIITLSWDNSGEGSTYFGLIDSGGSWVDTLDVYSSTPITRNYGNLAAGWYQVVVAPYVATTCNKDYTITIEHEYEYLLGSEPANSPVFTGVAPQSKIISLKILDDSGSGTGTWLQNAFSWISENGTNSAYNITVISMSLAFDGVYASIDTAVNNLVDEGFVCVASAGNDGTNNRNNAINSPGTAQKCITVGAVNDAFEIVFYSSNGDVVYNKPDVVAPGGTIALSGSSSLHNLILAADSNYGEDYNSMVDVVSNDYTGMLGTSMSCPHVAGLAQLIIDAIVKTEGSWVWSQSNALRVKQIICMGTWELNAGETFDGDGDGIPQNPPLNRVGRDVVEGFGMTRADAAIQSITNATMGPFTDVTYYLDRRAGMYAKEHKVVLFSLDVIVGKTYTFTLTVPSTGDFDLIIYDDDYEVSSGSPIVLSASTNSGLDSDESIVFTPTEDGIYYWSIRAVQGYGNCQISMSQSGNVPPNAPTNPSPAQGVNGVSLNPILSVDVFDSDGDSMDIYFYNSSDDTLIGTDLGVSSGSTASITWLGLSEGTMYGWYVVAYDGIDSTSSTNWTFTTSYAPNIPINPIPSDSAIKIDINPTLSVEVSDRDMDFMDVSFYDASDDSLIGTDPGVASGGTAFIIWFGLSEGTSYSWYALAFDGLSSTTSTTWVFTTNYAPDILLPRSPANGASGLGMNPTLSIDVIDLDGDLIDVSFYDASDDNLIGIDTGVISGGTASILWSNLSEGTTYTWYVIINDGILLTTSVTWSFTTNHAPNAPMNPIPFDNATGIILNPILSLDVSDLDGDLMDVSFYNASDDSLIGIDLAVSNGETASITWIGLNESTIYSWYALVSDGISLTTSTTWSFTAFMEKPVWKENPINQIMEYGESLIYDLNATDLSGIYSWWVNYTLYFTINKDGVITNTLSIPVGEYWLEVRAYDPYSNFCNATIKITVEDTISPTWDQVPINQVIEYGTTLSYDLNASDLSGILSYWINNTSNFNMSADGLLTNITALIAGTYWIEVRAYDPYDNFCTKIIKIIVEEPKHPEKTSSPVIPGYDIFLIFYTILMVFLLVLKRYRRKK